MTDERYYLVLRDHLGELGDSRGSTLEDLNILLSDGGFGVPLDDLAVIKGVEVPVVPHLEPPP